MIDVMAKGRPVLLATPSTEDPDNFEDIFARYVDPIHRFIYSRVGNREDAEDLTSEVFLKAARALEPGRAEASIAQWLFTVARTVLADHWRRYYHRGGARLSLDDNQAPDTAAPVHGQLDLARDQQVEDLLRALPPRYRLVLELRFLRGYSVLETAREMNITVDNAKVLQHRALARALQVGKELP